MEFRKRSLLLSLALGILIAASSASAQSRINTKKLSEELQRLAVEAEDESERLLAAAEDARRAADLTSERIEELDAEIARLERQIQEDREEKVEALEEVVRLMMAHEKIGPILQKSPQSIRIVPDIERILKSMPWLDPELDKILKDYP